MEAASKGAVLLQRGLGEKGDPGATALRTIGGRDSCLGQMGPRLFKVKLKKGGGGGFPPRFCNPGVWRESNARVLRALALGGKGHGRGRVLACLSAFLFRLQRSPEVSFKAPFYV